MVKSNRATCVISMRLHQLITLTACVLLLQAASELPCHGLCYLEMVWRKVQIKSIKASPFHHVVVGAQAESNAWHVQRWPWPHHWNTHSAFASFCSPFRAIELETTDLLEKGRAPLVPSEKRMRPRSPRAVAYLARFEDLQVQGKNALLLELHLPQVRNWGAKSSGHWMVVLAVYDESAVGTQLLHVVGSCQANVGFGDAPWHSMPQQPRLCRFKFLNLECALWSGWESPLRSWICRGIYILARVQRWAHCCMRPAMYCCTIRFGQISEVNWKWHCKCGRTWAWSKSTCAGAAISPSKHSAVLGGSGKMKSTSTVHKSAASSLWRCLICEVLEETMPNPRASPCRRRMCDMGCPRHPQGHACSKLAHEWSIVGVTWCGAAHRCRCHRACQSR